MRKGLRAPAAGPATTSTRTSRRATTPGTSACAWCPTATCSGAPRRPRLGRHRPHRDLHRDGHPLALRRRAGRRHRSSPRPGSSCCSSAASQLAVDGQPVDLSETDGLQGHDAQRRAQPRARFGYTNASWTLKCDLTCEYVCRLLNHMDAHGYAQCTPREPTTRRRARSRSRLHVGLRAARHRRVPQAGLQTPWRLYQNYALDIAELRRAPVEDGAIGTSRADPVARPAPAREPQPV